MLTKIVNGVVVQLTPREEADQLAEWTANEALAEQTRIDAQQTRQTLAARKITAQTKLEALGLTIEDLRALLS